MSYGNLLYEQQVSAWQPLPAQLILPQVAGHGLMTVKGANSNGLLLRLDGSLAPRWSGILGELAAPMLESSRSWWPASGNVEDSGGPAPELVT